jgi:hypothetical protein
MHREAARVGEHGAEDARRGASFEGAVDHARQVRDDEVDHPVLAVARGDDGGRVGRPHRRRAAGEAQVKAPLVARGRTEHRRVRAAEAEAAKSVEARTRMRREHRLRHTEGADGAHLREPLQGGCAWVRHLPAVRGAGQISGAQAAVVVRRTDQTVELAFRVAHEI